MQVLVHMPGGKLGAGGDAGGLGERGGRGGDLGVSGGSGGRGWRGPQSKQSGPYTHDVPYSEPGPPSSQSPSKA